MVLGTWEVGGGGGGEWMLGYSGAWKILFALVICDYVDCPESVVDSLSDSASDSFC